MKKAKKSAQDKQMPNASALQGVPNQHPHEEYRDLDADFKKHRGAKR